MMHVVEVTQVKELHPQLRRVRFEGDLSKADFVPGQVIEFRVSLTEFRHYTPSFYDQENVIFDVFFFLHD